MSWYCNKMYEGLEADGNSIKGEIVSKILLGQQYNDISGKYKLFFCN